MKFSIAPLAAAAALMLASGAGAQDDSGFIINTPSNLPTCQPFLITWSGGQPPYFLSLLPGGQPSALPVIDFGQQQGTSLRWVVNVTAAQYNFNIRDNNGVLKQSGAFNVIASSDVSCLTGGGGGGSSTTDSGSGSTTTPSGGNTPTTTPAPGGSSSTTPPAGGVSTSTKPPSSSGSGGAKPTNTPSAGSKVQVGIVAAVGAALLALVA